MSEGIDYTDTDKIKIGNEGVYSSVLLNMLENAFRCYIYKHSKNPTIIVVHPNTLRKLKDEAERIVNTNVYKLHRYRDVEIVRSFDVKEGEFKM